MFSINNVPIRLTDVQWGHIISRHPELNSQKEKIGETIENPDYIQKGDFDTLIAVRYFLNTPLTKKYCVVIYREVNEKEGFVITAYFATNPSKWRQVIWKR